MRMVENVPADQTARLEMFRSNGAFRLLTQHTLYRLFTVIQSQTAENSAVLFMPVVTPWHAIENYFQETLCHRGITRLPLKIWWGR